MDRQTYYTWEAENCTSSTREYYNGIGYIFATMKDGWIAISEVDQFGVYPQIQADNLTHARDWCFKRERLNFPVSELVPREEAI